MPSLKDLRNRISSVKSTKKITSAMKMVAAAKLKKAQDNAISARPYADRMQNIINSISKNSNINFQFPSLISGTGENKKILLIVCSADRGLCGGFNSSIIRYTKKKVDALIKDGKEVKFIFIGKKANNALKRSFEKNTLNIFTDISNPNIDFNLITEVRDSIIDHFNNGLFDSCELIFTKFISAISQKVEKMQIIPLENNMNVIESNNVDKKNSIYEFEPNEEEILEKIVPQNIAIQIFTGLLESSASEQGARMTAMDNATRNANEKIDDLTMFYNRSRQAVITKELIEIISGAEAI
ncbi:MAG: F0F1 ATP synthase subunit gamma [Rickettsiales bacterium]|nr:F0F1 ATP synthase subunit gamma [Rickettsiales bacterium]|tara:strand:- start:1805 stop:2695 length:891 start_codon:yes stop_codon:yes gene_type:complete